MNVLGTVCMYVPSIAGYNVTAGYYCTYGWSCTVRSSILECLEGLESWVDGGGLGSELCLCLCLTISCLCSSFQVNRGGVVRFRHGGIGW